MFFNWSAVLLCLAFYACNGNEVYAEEEKSFAPRLFEKELQCILKNLTEGADPLVVGDVNDFILDIPGEIWLKATFKDMVVANVSSTYSNLLTMIGTTLRANIMIPDLMITADPYNLLADIFLFNITGQGNCVIYLKDINFALNMTIQVPPTGDLKARDVSTFISIGKAETQLENLMGGGDASDYMNAVLSDMIPTLIEVGQKLLTDQVNFIITEMADELIKGKNLAELFAMIRQACNPK